MTSGTDPKQDPLSELMAAFPQNTRKDIENALQSANGSLDDAAAILSIEQEESDVLTLMAIFFTRSPAECQEALDHCHGDMLKASEMLQQSEYLIHRIPYKPSRAKTSVTYDLHGFLANTATTYVLFIVRNAQRNNVSKITFITGKGLHSPGGRPILRGLVVGLCRKEGFQADIMASNTGCVEVIIN